MKSIKSILSGAAIITFTTVASSAALIQRTYSSGNFALDLDGVKCGAVKSVSGGDITADVLTQTVGADILPVKHIGQPKYEDFSLAIGLGMEKSFYDWISATVDGNFLRKSGMIHASDANLVERQRAEFFNAFISEITIPACDASAKDPAYLNVKFSPEYTRWTKGDTKRSSSIATPTSTKALLPSNFVLDINGLNCTHVQRIEAFTLKQTAAQDSAGVTRNYVADGKVEYPNLRITVTADTADTWIDWANNFIINGKHLGEDEKTGKLSFLSPDYRTELMRIDLDGVGISRLGRVFSSGDRPDTVTVELYVERMEIAFMAQFDKN